MIFAIFSAIPLIVSCISNIRNTLSSAENPAPTHSFTADDDAISIELRHIDDDAASQSPMPHISVALPDVPPSEG
jgi:hypothetical protein